MRSRHDRHRRLSSFITHLLFWASAWHFKSPERGEPRHGQASEAQSNVQALALLLLGCLCKLTLRRLRVWRMSACVRDIMAERSAQFLTAVREELRVVGTTRNRDISHAVVKQVFRSKLSVHVDEYPVGSLPLARVAGHGVAVVKMRMLHKVKLHLSASVH